MTERRPPHGAPLYWVRQDASLGPAEDLDHGLTLLRAVQSGAAPAPLVRIYRRAPTVAFGDRKCGVSGKSVALGGGSIIKRQK